MSDDPEIEIAKVLFTESVRALDEQSARVESIRGRAVTLLVTTTALAAFLGEAAIGSGIARHVELFVGALLVTALGGSLSIAAFAPRSGWKRAPHVASLVDQMGQGRRAVDLYAALARTYDESVAENERFVRNAVMWFRLSAWLLLAQLGSWAWLLWVQTK